MKHCKTCKNWYGKDEAGPNECRANAPQAGSLPNALAAWPLTKATMGCFEHEERESK